MAISSRSSEDSLEFPNEAEYCRHQDCGALVVRKRLTRIDDGNVWTFDVRTCREGCPLHGLCTASSVRRVER